MENYKYPNDSKIISTDQVLINDLNNYITKLIQLLKVLIIVIQFY